MSNALSLDSIVNIEVKLPARTTSGRNCDLVLLIGSTNVVTAEERIKIYTSATEMLSDGFLESDRLYKAAVLVLGQSVSPSRVAIGRIGTVSEGEEEDPRTETPVEIITACRAANDEWYAAVYCAETDDEGHLALAEYCETAFPSCIYAYSSSDSAVSTIPKHYAFAYIQRIY